MSFKALLEEEAVRTLFQPIVSFTDSSPEVYAVEALTRGPKNTPYESAMDLFDTAEEQNRLYDLEQIARKKAIERLVERVDHQTLFLNRDPNVIYDSSFQDENLINYLEERNLSRDNIVFEITERNQIRNREAFENAIRHYREKGFRVAVDDVGSGYSNLDKIARLQPEFIKIDMSVVRNLHLNRPRFQLVDTIYRFARRIGANVVAEGIESREELQTLLSMGIEYAQGYFLSSPAAVPDPPGPGIRETHRHSQNTRNHDKDVPVIGSLIRPGKNFNQGTSLRDVYRFLRQNPTVNNVAIVDGDNPVGILERKEVEAYFSSDEISEREDLPTVKETMNDNVLITPCDTTLNDVLDQITSGGGYSNSNTIIVVDSDSGSYLGTVTAQQFLEAFSELENPPTRRPRPVTTLPGEVEIRERIQQYLDQDETFTLVKADLDDFRTFNRNNGYDLGDQIIVILKNILEDGLEIHQSTINFLGHAGGGEFYALLTRDNAEPFSKYVTDQFDQRIQELQKIKDFGTQGPSRPKDGSKSEDNLTVSLTGVDSDKRNIDHFMELMDIISEVEHSTKDNHEESGYVIRQD